MSYNIYNNARNNPFQNNIVKRTDGTLVTNNLSSRITDIEKLFSDIDNLLIYSEEKKKSDKEGALKYYNEGIKSLKKKVEVFEKKVIKTISPEENEVLENKLILDIEDKKNELKEHVKEIEDFILTETTDEEKASFINIAYHTCRWYGVNIIFTGKTLFSNSYKYVIKNLFVVFSYLCEIFSETKRYILIDIFDSLSGFVSKKIEYYVRIKQFLCVLNSVQKKIKYNTLIYNPYDTNITNKNNETIEKTKEALRSEKFPWNNKKFNWKSPSNKDKSKSPSNKDKSKSPSNKDNSNVFQKNSTEQDNNVSSSKSVHGKRHGLAGATLKNS